MRKTIPETTELAYLDACELAALIRKGKLSARELMQSYFQQLSLFNPKINAIIDHLDESEALQLADEADRQLAKGEKIGPLHGIPLAAKEMLEVKGWKQTYCWAAGVVEEKLSAMGLNDVLEEDGLLAGRMREAGVLYVGKTNIPEFAFGSHTKNRLYGVTRNPYDLRKSSGGSSGGAAAALAAGIVSIADGSDLGGSLRNPAAFCNVIGFRPSIGRIPGKEAGWEARMGTEGPMARSVDDIALLFSAQAGPHKNDPLSIHESGERFREIIKKDHKGIRIGWTSDFGHLAVEDEVKKVCKNALTYFEDIGVEVSGSYPDIMRSDGENGIEDAMRVFRTLRTVSLGCNVLAFHHALGEGGIRKYMGPIAQYQMLDAYHAVGTMEICKANENRQRIYREFMEFFDQHDFLVCPSTQVLPFDVEWDYVEKIGDRVMKDYLEWMSICCILSTVGLPIISMPCGFSKQGLPVGLQIIGKPQADLEVLQLAKAFESASRVSAKFNPPAIPV
ncbi:MAG: amidase family protein [Bacteroidota bacterium]